MYKYRGKKCNLREMFENCVNDKRKGILIVYIWVNECNLCGERINVIDDEYSLEISSENESITINELLECYKSFLNDYSIWENYFEEDINAFTYINYDELNNRDVYYFYSLDYTNKEYCKICEDIFF